jgi:SAM-dependent methyltransferase
MSSWRPHRGGRPFTRDALGLWLRSPRGLRLLQTEAREVKRVLPDIFGRCILQVGSWGRGDQLLEACETLHHAILGTVPDFGAGLVTEPERLPVADRAVDGVLLPHTLEFTRSPHNLLREASRILTDRGRLFVLGFNPWGTWGLRQRLGLRYRAFPPGARFYSVGRVCDWLELLDFEVTEVRRFGVGFPWHEPRSDGEAWSIGSVLGPLSEAYLVAAKKRVLPVNLVGRVARVQIKPLVGVPVSAVQIGHEARETSGVVTPLFPRPEPRTPA